jgi:hypothetical protein
MNLKIRSQKAKKPMVFELDIEFLKTPPEPLILLINPSSLEIKFTSKITEQRIRWTGYSTAYVFHAHHDELDVLSASGKSAMFMSSTKGLDRLGRTDTYTYKNVERLVAIYRNNGMNLNKKPGSTSKCSPCAIDSVGRVIIYYNDFVYKGHFTSFSVSENDTNPFNVDFTFEFKVTKTFSGLQLNEDNTVSNRVRV